MTPIQEALSNRIKSLEKELERVLDERWAHGIRTSSITATRASTARKSILLETISSMCEL
jgi:hypothetical protein